MNLLEKTVDEGNNHEIPCLEEVLKIDELYNSILIDSYLDLLAFNNS